jgi:predicted metalloprotease with PDZ domain
MPRHRTGVPRTPLSARAALLSLLAAAVLRPSPLDAQEAVSYTVSFGNAVHHEADVTVRFAGVPRDTLEVRMSRSSPGRYALMEFARNVYRFRAFDGRGRELAVTKPDPHQWNVAGHDGTVEVRYTLFGDHASGTFTGIDATHAHLSMPATFAWARGMESRPVEIEFRPPAGSRWKAATQLFPTHHPMMFTAPGLQYFMDSPTELSDHTVRLWRTGPGDSAYTIRLALHHEGTDAEADAFAAMAERITGEAFGVFGEYPAYENGEYVFIVDCLPWVSGDGMEHRNSTSITGTHPLRTSAAGSIGTVAHEFFHCWNVERIRPRPLEPFDFEKSNMSAELWFAEGVTNYYDRLLRVRAGITGVDAFTGSLGSTLGWFLDAPGRGYFSAGEMSMMAAVTDGAIFPDRMNTPNTWISYYTFGDMIGLALDLTLRIRFPGLSLDEFMRAVWRRHGRTELPYTNADLEAALGEMTGDPAFAGEFFAKYVTGHDVAAYGKLLEGAGLLLRRKDSAKASLGGVFLEFRDGRAVVASQPVVTSAVYRAGLDRGDTILSIDGGPVSSQAGLDSLLSKHRPGDRVDVEFIQRGSRSDGTM